MNTTLYGTAMIRSKDFLLVLAESQPSRHTGMIGILQTPSSNSKNKNLKKQDNSDSVCINRDDCMSSDNLCVSNSIDDRENFASKTKVLVNGIVVYAHLKLSVLSIYLARQDLYEVLPKLKFEWIPYVLHVKLEQKFKDTPQPKSEDTNQEKTLLLAYGIYVGQCVYDLRKPSDASEQIMELSLLIRHCCEYMRRLASLMKHQLHALYSIKTVLLKEKYLLFPKSFHDVVVTVKTPYELLHDKPPDLSYLHVFGALCYPTNDSENLGKLQPKADIADAMASDIIVFQGTALHEMTSCINSVQDSFQPSYSTLLSPPSRSDGICCSYLCFDESLNPPTNVDLQAPEVIAPIPEAVAPEHAVSTGSPSSTIVDQDAPSPSLDGSPRGYRQEEGIIFEESSLRDASLEAIRIFLGVCCSLEHWSSIIEDVKTAFLNGSVDPTLFIRRLRQRIILVQIYVDDISLLHLLLNCGYSMVEKSQTDEDKKGSCCRSIHYRGMIGTFLYLTASRPDLQFAICMCARLHPVESSKEQVVQKEYLAFSTGMYSRAGLLYDHAMACDYFA
ncbi:hypothetical protein Tco_1448492 [Tanacetum coccineum]